MIDKTTDGYKYVYQYKDHLQNVRLSYSDKNKDGSISQGEIIQEKNYYPFGMIHSGYNFAVNGRKHNYGFGNKEEQDELDLGWIDITARNYDPALGRWMNLDPLAEQMRRHSPYNYAFDNPISFIDPDGMAPFWINNGDGTYTAEAGDSASTLATDAGISFERAKEIMANTPNESSSLGNMGTYVDSEDGVEKSAVDEGDVVAVPEQVEAIAENEAAVENLENEIGTNETTKTSIKNENDSLNKVKNRISDNLSLQIESGVFEGEEWDRGADKFLKISQLIQVGIVTKKSKKIDKKVNKNNQTIDSLDKVNKSKREEITRRGYLPPSGGNNN